MAEIQPIVSDASIGNATVGIDCVWIKCIESVDITISMEEVPIVCDWADGPVTILRGNPTALINIMALNLNATTLKYALDATTLVKAGDEEVACEEHQITWVPEDTATPAEWTATVVLNSPEVESVTVWTDSDCAVTWESDSTPDNDIAITDACAGIVTLTTDDVLETDATLYFAYVHNTETPVGATKIRAPMSTFADDHKLHILHRNATTGSLDLFKFWRVQIIPDVNIVFDNTNKFVTVPIKLRAFAVRDSHANEPIVGIRIIGVDDSEVSDFAYDIYKKVRTHI